MSYTNIAVKGTLQPAAAELLNDAELGNTPTSASRLCRQIDRQALSPNTTAHLRPRHAHQPHRIRMFVKNDEARRRRHRAPRLAAQPPIGTPPASSSPAP